MYTSINKCLANLKGDLSGLRKLDSTTQSQFGGASGKTGAIAKGQFHLLTEAIFFAAFRSYEQFLSNVFLLYCSGFQRSSRRLVRTYLQPKTLGHAEELVKSSMPFLDWSSPNVLIERSETYLKDGYPIKDSLTLHVEKLNDLKRIRNHIAHMSTASLSEYKKVLRRHFSVIPLKIPLPGEFLLLSSRSTPGTYYLLEYIDLIEEVAEQIC